MLNAKAQRPKLLQPAILMVLDLLMMAKKMMMKTKTKMMMMMGL